MERPIVGHEAHQPFITWLVQDGAILELQDAVMTGRDTGMIKSRDMGASWMCLAVIHHFFQFAPNSTFKELSRKEELVDSIGDMDSLFEKHRYMLRMQPEWLRPKRMADKRLLLENKDINSSIVGESTNSDAGQGGRKTAILIDEAGRIDNLEEIELATADTTSCRIFNSTPSGPGTGFHKLFKSKRCKWIELWWWQHPEKGMGAHQERDDKGIPRWTNKWYELESLRRSKKDMAQNIDGDFGQAGDNFFDIKELESHAAAHVRPPAMTLRLEWASDRGREYQRNVVRRRRYMDAIPLYAGRMPWRFWVPLVDGRPPQQYTYIFGIDISNGSGASNSVITVGVKETGQIVAKFWDSNVTPEELAEQAALAGIWFGGLGKTAFIMWENNGPGGIFGRKLVKLGYANIYINKVDDVIREKKTQRWGWHSNNKKKEILLARYREDLRRGSIVNPCEESIIEAGDYVYADDGTLVPGRLRQEKQGGRALHGDHVIADGLFAMGREEIPATRGSSDAPPFGSFAQRRDLRERKRDTERNAWAR